MSGPRSKRDLFARHTLWVVAIGLAVCQTAEADRSSGTWTGKVEARGNYYWETSTRVVAPEFAAQVESPDGFRLRGHYLIDSITSASVAAGTLVDVNFTEIRHDFGAGVGYEFDFGEQQLDIGLDGRYSTEPDYRSQSGTFSAKWSLDERNTELTLSATQLHDQVGSVLRSLDSNAVQEPGDVGTLNATVLAAGWMQLINPQAFFTVGYDLGLQSGFLSNVYRSVSLGAAPVQEKHPDSRARHTVHGRFAYYFPATGTALHALMRAYTDDWDVNALTPEARIYQEIGGLSVLRLRYRYYTQTRAFFQKDMYSADDEFYTADQKMYAFHSHLLGTQMFVPLSFLENTTLDFLSQGGIDFSFEYLWTTNLLGNAVISQAGLQVPF